MHVLLPRRKAHAASATLLRFFETGPWGILFDRLTWLPWSRTCAHDATARCVYIAGNLPPSQTNCDDLPARPAGSVRVVFCSDTHGKHRLLRLPAGDMLCHCGDLLSRNACIGLNGGRPTRRALAALRDFDNWLSSTPFRDRVVIGGNHDATLEQIGVERARALLQHAHYLQNSFVTIQGLTVYGSPWSPSGHSANRAFQRDSPTPPPPNLPTIDILLSHCHHEQLASAVAPRVYAAGHAHEKHGADVLGDGRVVLNASMCDGLYRAVHLPIVVDVPRVHTTPQRQ